MNTGGIYNLLFTIGIFFWVQVSWGQTGKILSKKKADNYFSVEIYQLALPTYLSMLNEDPENLDLNFRAGVCYVNSPEKSKAVPFLEKTIELGFAPAYFYLGQVKHFENHLDSAIANYLLFKRYATREQLSEYDVDRYIRMTQLARHLMENPLEVTIENLGPNVNSAFPDYVPVVSADESTMIFTSRRKGSTGGLIDPDGAYYEDIYISVNDGKGWGQAQNMGDVVNTENHEASVGLSADGQKLILYRMSQGSYGGDLYYSSLDGSTWGKPQKVEGEINSGYWEPSACLSADEKMIIFSSNRPGGYGGRDLYLARKLPNGNWAKPMNLGPIINTEFDEDAPFLHPDGKTLFFSSKGHSTMGGFDIFKTSMLDNELWTLPENIGYPINTVDDDIYFVLSTDGQRGYYSSDKEGGLGGKDIYVVYLTEEKIPLTVFTGKVLDSKKNMPVKASITIINTDSKEVQGIYKANTETGKYIIILPTEKKFKAIIESEGYHSLTEIIEPSSEREFKEINRDFQIKPLK